MIAAGDQRGTGYRADDARMSMNGAVSGATSAQM